MSDNGGEKSSGRARTLARIEILALALLTVAPILPYVLLVLGQGVPRFDLVADLAWMEYDTRHVWNGDTLIGLSSRFGWSHPGPLLFYFAAPFESLFKGSSAGLYVATSVLSAAAMATVVLAARVLAGRAHAIAALVVLVGWLAAFGNVAINPWVRTVVVLPLLAFFVLAAFLSRGHSVVAPAAALFGAIAGHTHVATVPTLVAVGVVALASFAVDARRRGGLSVRARRHMVAAACLLAVTLVPPLIEQLRAPPGTGNIAKLAHFFLHRPEPYKSLGHAIRDWVTATGWLPDRILSASLLQDEAIPFAMRWDSVPARASRTAMSIAVIRVVLMICAAVVARRRRDGMSLALLTFGALGDLLSLLAVRSIIGEVHFSLLFWITAPSSVGWMGILSSFGDALGAAAARRGVAIRPIAIALAAAAIAAVVATTMLQRSWLARFPYAPASFPHGNEARRAIYAALREQSRRDAVTPVIHLDGAWGTAVALILEYDRDGEDVRVGEGERWGFPGGRSAATAPRARHFWFAEPSWPVPFAQCLEVLMRVGDITVLSAPSAVTSCAASAP